MSLGRPPSHLADIPFLTDLVFNLGWFSLIFGTFIIVGAGNAVNSPMGSTDLRSAGDDRGRLFRRVLHVSRFTLTEYLQLHFVPGTGELAILCGSVIGAGWLPWFNAPPASIFMGDTGSLALGGLLGSVRATKHDLTRDNVGGCSCSKRSSVIVQVISFSSRQAVFRRRRCTIIRAEGWTEPQIVIRFWIIASCRAVGLRREVTMIAVTTFAEKRSRCSSRRLGSPRARVRLLAGGADVVAFATPKQRHQGERPAFQPPIFAISTGPHRRADTPRRRAAAHPAPHWSVASRHAAVEVIATSNCSVGAAQTVPDAPFRRITGTTANHHTALVGIFRECEFTTYSLGAISAPRSLSSSRRRRACARDRVRRSRSIRAFARSIVGILLNVAEDHSSHGALKTTPRSRTWWRRARDVPRCRRRTTTGVRRGRTASGARQARGARLGGPSALRRTLCRGRPGDARGQAARARVVQIGASDHCAARQWQNAACATGAALALGLAPRRSKGLVSFPGLAPHGAVARAGASG